MSCSPVEGLSTAGTELNITFCLPPFAGDVLSSLTIPAEYVANFMKLTSATHAAAGYAGLIQGLSLWVCLVTAYTPPPGNASVKTQPAVDAVTLNYVLNMIFA